MFDYMLVSLEGNLAYCIGTKKDCQIYQMKHGLRAKTEILYLPECGV